MPTHHTTYTPSYSRARQFRLQKIDEALRTKTYPSAAELAKICEVSLRTIERDIDFLVAELAAPIEYDAMKRGWYYITENFYIPYFQLTQGELFSIALFDPILKQYRNTPIDFEIFSTVMNCTKKHQTITFDYKPLQKTTFMERELDPYHIVCQRGNWYVMGFCHDKNEVRIFNFARMKNLKKSSKHFKVPSDFSPDKYIDPSMGVWLSAKEKIKVKLLFDISISTFASEHFFHENQKVKTNKDGTVQVEFETTQMPEVLRWVLGQGTTVKVLEPPELVEKVKSELKKTIAMYK